MNFLIIGSLLVFVSFLLGSLKLYKDVRHQWTLYWRIKSIPGPSLYSNVKFLWRLLKNFNNNSSIIVETNNYLNEICLNYGDKCGIVKLWFLMFQPWIIICDANLARKILNDPTCQSKWEIYKWIENSITLHYSTSHEMPAISNGASMTIYFLAHHANVQKLVQDELDACNVISNGVINAGNLSRLRYLECCIMETLRLAPYVSILARKNTQAISFDHQLTIPANCKIVINLQYLNTKCFSDKPEQFCPERFWSVDSSCENYFFCPFGTGPRECTKRAHALDQIKDILVNIFSDYTVAPLNRLGDAQLWNSFVFTDEEIDVKFNKRNK